MDDIDKAIFKSVLITVFIGAACTTYAIVAGIVGLFT